MFSKIGKFAVEHRWWVIAGWLLIAGLLFFLAPSLSQVGTMTESNFLPENSESLRARELITQYFPQTQAASTVTLVFYNSNQISDTDMAYAQQVNNWLTSGETPFKVEYVNSVFTNPEMQSRLVSPDQTTMLLNVGLDKAAFESDSIQTTQAIKDYLGPSSDGLEVYISGQVGVYSDLFDSLNQSIQLTTIITIILVIVLLIVIFRSPVAALVPLLTIGVAFLVARGIMGLIGQAGVPIWSQIEIFLVVLIFGIGTDYCLFLISRFREELRHGDTRSQAMRFSVSKIGAVITASAFAVIAGMAGMAIAQYQMIQVMGPLLGIAILITLLAALTLAPALASLFGSKLFWPTQADRQQPTVERYGFWHRIAGLATRRPLIVAVAVIVVMLIPYVALPRLNQSFDQMSEIPPDTGSVAGFNILQQHYDIGEMDPVTVILAAPEGQTLTTPEALQALKIVSNNLHEVSNVVRVQSIVYPDGSQQTPAELTAAGQLSSIGQSIQQSLNAVANGASLPSGTDVTSGFAVLQAYLEELAQSFDWIKTDAAFQGLISDLQSIQGTVAQINTTDGTTVSQENLQNVLGPQVEAFSTHLSALSNEFTNQGNPAFLSQTLMASSTEYQNLMSIFCGKDSQATKLFVVLDAYPQSDTALTAVDDIRNVVQSSLNGTTLQGVEAATGGTTAELADVRTVLEQDFTRIMIVVLAAVFIVLALLLRSLVAPIYLLLTVLLSYGTTLGLVTWIFQGILGYAGISFMIPILVLVLLIALGSDYNIFLMSRVREESQSRSTRDGTRLALIATGGVITACGIILAGTFGSLVTTPIRTLTEIGAAVAIGVLIDTFVVRALLVPALASLFGRWNWWPVLRKNNQGDKIRFV